MSCDREKIISSMLAMWEAALELEPRPDDAIALLADACAFGLNEGDFGPAPILQRISATFDALHVAKHVGVKH